MAYLSLYRKWRPSTFKEIIGQKHISIPILRAFEQNRLAHAYLFPAPWHRKDKYGTNSCQSSKLP